MKTIHTLICARDLPLARATLGSFCRCSAEPVRFAFHEDGSLTPADVEALQAAFPGCSVIGRTQGDDEIYPRLAGYRHCQAFRRASVYARKLFDIPLIAQPEIFYSDLDILFFRKFRGLFDWPDDETQGMFMRDIDSYYSVSSRLVFQGKVKVIQSLNAGFYHIRGGFMDLDLVNWFLGRKEFRTLYGVVEQTCWAVLAAGRRVKFWEPTQVSVVDSTCFEPGSSRLLIGHFSGPSRPLLAKELARGAGLVETGEAERIECAPARVWTPAGVLAYQLKKKLSLLPWQRQHRQSRNKASEARA